jgi:hypothetical protein
MDQSSTLLAQSQGIPKSGAADQPGICAKTDNHESNGKAVPKFPV